MNTNLAYEEEPWEEIVGGQVVLMSPRPAVDHNRVARNITYIFMKHLEGRLCEPFSDGTDLYLSEEDRFIPDFMIVCDPKKVKPDGVYGAPDLVVEVLSPSTVKNDRIRKKEAYEKAGVREYWIVSPGDKTIEQYFLEEQGFTLHKTYGFYPRYRREKMTPEEREANPEEFHCSLYEDFTIRVAEVFRRVSGAD